MAALALSREEQRVLAEASLFARYGEEDSPVTPKQILRPRRAADVGGNLWTTFNIIQENIIRGGHNGTRQAEDGRIICRQTRPINGIDQNVGVNRALWTLAEGMKKLKALSPIAKAAQRSGLGWLKIAAPGTPGADPFRSGQLTMGLAVKRQPKTTHHAATIQHIDKSDRLAERRRKLRQIFAQLHTAHPALRTQQRIPSQSMNYG